MKNAKVISSLANGDMANVSILRNFWHYNTNQVINQRICNKSTNVGYIQKNWYILLYYTWSSDGPNKTLVPIYGYTNFGRNKLFLGNSDEIMHGYYLGDQGSHALKLNQVGPLGEPFWSTVKC